MPQTLTNEVACFFSGSEYDKGQMTKDKGRSAPQSEQKW